MTGHEHPAPHGAGPDEVYEQDVVRPVRPVIRARSQGPSAGRAGRGGLRRMAVPGAVVATLLVAGLALGAGGLLPVASLGIGSRATETPAGPTPAAPAAVSATPDATHAQVPANTVTQPPEATAPAVAPMTLTADFTDNHVELAWSGCAVEGFAYWKVVRSKDATAAWPLGEDDTLIAAIAEQDALTAADRSMPRGATSWYRVFAVVAWNGELTPVCASDAHEVSVPAPTPKPTAEPTPKPTPKTMNLEAKLKNGVPYLHWTACTSDRFDYYKVVRSTDSTVEWPSGDGDTLIAAISNPDELSTWDSDAPVGETSYYKVFCVDATDAGYITLDATPVRSLKVVSTEPPPAPTALGFSAVFDGGSVHLSWDSCACADFVYYKVVRSHSIDPSYLPWTDGTELIGVISNPSEVTYDDGSVTSGDVWHYRIQALGWWNGQKVVLCQSAVVEVVIP